MLWLTRSLVGLQQPLWDFALEQRVNLSLDLLLGLTLPSNGVIGGIGLVTLGNF